MPSAALLPYCEGEATAPALSAFAWNGSDGWGLILSANNGIAN